MARKALKPCRHPGCPALTREGWCPKHQPAPRQARRKESAAWHGWYSKAVWTQELRPAQLMREPFCRVCAAKGWRTMWAPSGGTGRCSSARPTTRACASSTTTRRPPGSRQKNGVRPGDFDGCFPPGSYVRAGARGPAQARRQTHTRAAAKPPSPSPGCAGPTRSRPVSGIWTTSSARGQTSSPMCSTPPGRTGSSGGSASAFKCGGGEPGPHPAPALAGV